jgi:hypothetical protein
MASVLIEESLRAWAAASPRRTVRDASTEDQDHSKWDRGLTAEGLVGEGNQPARPQARRPKALRRATAGAMP